MLMRTVDGRVDADGPVDLAGGVRASEDLRVDPIPGAIRAEPAMALPRSLPRPKLGRQIPPRRARPKPPHDPLHHPAVVPERAPTLTGSDRHQRLDPGPSSIRESTNTRHPPSLPSTWPGGEDTRPGPRLEANPLGIGCKDDPVSLVFTADAGSAVVLAMSDMRDRFRLVANVVRNVGAPDLPRLPVGRAVWSQHLDFATSTSCWLAAGAAHHTVMTTAVGIDVIQDFADIAGTELLVIDADTTVRGFARKLRWNQAYYRISHGL